jgi:hypothetical protein
MPPTTCARNGGRKTSDGMVILLPLGVALKRRAECRESIDLGFGECVGRWHVTLRQLDIRAGGIVAIAASFTSRSAEASWLSPVAVPPHRHARNEADRRHRAAAWSVPPRRRSA